MTAAQAEHAISGPESPVADLKVQAAEQPGQLVADDSLSFLHRLGRGRGQGRQRHYEPGLPSLQVLGRPPQVQRPERTVTPPLEQAAAAGRRAAGEPGYVI